MCGEHTFGFPDLYPVMGSSPHVRGTRGGTTAAIDGVGIIPACAGNTRMRPELRPSIGDHPRMCGEHTKKIAQYQRYRKR